jgi:hypothetical protein
MLSEKKRMERMIRQRSSVKEALNKSHGGYDLISASLRACLNGNFMGASSCLLKAW